MDDITEELEMKLGLKLELKSNQKHKDVLIHCAQIQHKKCFHKSTSTHSWSQT